MVEVDLCPDEPECLAAPAVLGADAGLAVGASAHVQGRLPTASTRWAGVAASAPITIPAKAVSSRWLAPLNAHDPYLP